MLPAIASAGFGVLGTNKTNHAMKNNLLKISSTADEVKTMISRVAIVFILGVAVLPSAKAAIMTYSITSGLLNQKPLVPGVPGVQTPFGANIQPIWSGPDNAQGKFTENPTFRVTFNYPVTGVDVSDFNINVVNLVIGSDTPSTSITQITPSEYILNVALPANSILPSVVDSASSFTYISVNIKNDATISPQASFASQQSYTVGTTPKQVTMGDVNGDGKLDIITANSGSNNVCVLLGNGDGEVEPVHGLLVAEGELRRAFFVPWR